MADDFENDPLIYSDLAKAKMTADPDLAEAMREIAATMRQAHHAWQSGRYASFDDAMYAITGRRPEKINTEDLPVEVLEMFNEVVDSKGED
jgi:hypothetical protein